MGIHAGRRSGVAPPTVIYGKGQKLNFYRSIRSQPSTPRLGVDWSAFDEHMTSTVDG